MESGIKVTGKKARHADHAFLMSKLCNIGKKSREKSRFAWWNTVTRKKEAQKREGVEYAGKAQKIRLCLYGNMHESDVAPHEIFTLLIDEGGAIKVNLLEEAL